MSARTRTNPTGFVPVSAEREGFEPSRELVTPYSLSRRAPSSARPPLHSPSLPGIDRLSAPSIAVARRHYRGPRTTGADISIDEPQHDPDDFAAEMPSRGRAWAQTILIAIGMLIVGTALVLVIAMLITLTLGLISELF